MARVEENGRRLHAALRARRHLRGLPLVTASAIVIVIVVLVASFEMAAAQVSATTADAATALLEGHAIDQGSMLLQGWSLSLDSFWGLEALAYAVVLPFTGVHLYVLHAVPALLATGIVVSGAVLATWGQQRRSGVVALLTLGALLVLPGPDLSYFFLQGPWHVATTLACLVAFWLVSGEIGWVRSTFAAVVLAVAVTSDATALVIGVAPILAVGVLQLARTRRLRPAVPLLAVPLGALVLAAFVHVVGRWFGMYTLVNRNLVISKRQLHVNLELLVPHLKALFGVGDLPLGSLTQQAGAFGVARAAALGVVLAAVVVGVGRGLRVLAQLVGPRPPLSRARVIEAILLACFALDLAFFVIGSANGHVEFTKYLTTGVIVISVATARFLGEVSPGLPRLVARSVSVVTLASVALFGVQFFSLASKAAPLQKSHQLTDFLNEHHLGSGIASYPIASLVSVDSSLEQVLRPVSASSHGEITSFGRQEDSRWYEGHTFRFLVYDTSVPWHGVNRVSAEKTFGPVERTYRVGPYRVLVWTRAVTVRPNPLTGSSPLRLIFRL